MKKAIRKVTYKLKASLSQEESLMAWFVHHQQLYNWALHERIEIYRDSDHGLNFSEQYKINSLTEKLTVKNMTRSPKGSAEKHGKNIKQKAELNREILNTAPVMTLNLLRYKAEEASREFVEIPTRQVKPSQTCPDCGAKKKKSLA